MSNELEEKKKELLESQETSFNIVTRLNNDGEVLQSSAEKISDIDRELTVSGSLIGDIVNMGIE